MECGCFELFCLEENRVCLLIVLFCMEDCWLEMFSVEDNCAGLPFTDDSFVALTCIKGGCVELSFIADSCVELFCVE